MSTLQDARSSQSAVGSLSSIILTLLLLAAVSLADRHPNLEFRAWFYSEAGPLETLQAAILLLTCLLAASSLPQVAQFGSGLLRLWPYLILAGGLYTAGEELSWGQHLFHWETPEAWRDINDQGETNLHNVSSWFDQKPRLLLELAVVFGGIVMPLLLIVRPAMRVFPLAVLIPPLAALPAAVIAEFIGMQDRILDLLGQNRGLFFDRSAELQELFFYLFLLICTTAFSWRLRRYNGRPAVSLRRGRA